MYEFSVHAHPISGKTSSLPSWEATRRRTVMMSRVVSVLSCLASQKQICALLNLIESSMVPA